MAERNVQVLIDKYIEDTLNGTVPACKWEKLSIQRHLNDLQNGSERGLEFIPSKGMRVITFIEKYCRHAKGIFAKNKKPIVLEPFQLFLIYNLFGWYYTTGARAGYRRFRTSYCELVRKSGKSLLAAALAVYMLIADNEEGAEVYSVATKADQAKIVFDLSSQIIKKDTGLSEKVKRYHNNLYVESTGSKFTPLSSEADTLDGLNTSFCVCDELSKWNNKDLYSVMETSMGARTQPLMMSITTAGNNVNGICYTHRKRTEAVLEGVIIDDSWHGLILTIDDTDDYNDESCWCKANKLIGVSANIEDIRDRYNQAIQMPSMLNAFLKYYLDIWVASESTWIEAETWAACAGDLDYIPKLVGQSCSAGLDLSSNIDLTAYCLVFPPQLDSKLYSVLPRFFIPKDNMDKRVKRDKVPYDVWCRDGWIKATSGNTIDYDFVIASLLADAKKYNIKNVYFDRWGSNRISQQLINDGLSMVEFGQGFASMASPTKELEKIILSKELQHFNNPVLKWNIANIVIKYDPAGNMKIDKDKSIEKVDGAIGLVMGLAGALTPVAVEPDFTDYAAAFKR